MNKLLGCLHLRIAGLCACWEIVCHLNVFILFLKFSLSVEAYNCNHRSGINFKKMYFFKNIVALNVFELFNGILDDSNCQSCNVRARWSFSVLIPFTLCAAYFCMFYVYIEDLTCMSC